MSFSENATVFSHDADPKAIQAARAKGQTVVILPRPRPIVFVHPTRPV